MHPVLGRLRLRYPLEEQPGPGGVGVGAGRHVAEGAAAVDLDDVGLEQPACLEQLADEIAVVLLLVVQRLRPEAGQRVGVGRVEDDLTLVPMLFPLNVPVFVVD